MNIVYQLFKKKDLIKVCFNTAVLGLLSDLTQMRILETGSVFETVAEQAIHGHMAEQHHARNHNPLMI